MNINWLAQNEDKSYRNEIVLSEARERFTRNLSSESELHRILKHIYKKEHGHIEVNEAGREIIPYLITLEIGKNVKRYKVLMDNCGTLKVTREGVTTEYISQFCGASHSRTQKNLFVDQSIKDKLDDILLCGIPKDTVYPKPSKWNAYYALVTTNSQPVSTPNIVVIDDYMNLVPETVDVVKVTGCGEKKDYSVLPEPVQKDIEILPFDGAGLVTPECAKRWAEELDCRSKKTGRRYIPSCFQFRCLPALKGEAFVFDLKEFAREKGVSKIVDLGGKEWDIFTDQIDMVVTKSQFKFWNLYLDTEANFDCQLWKKAFSEEVHGYKRTFNIAKYADAPEDLKNTSLLSYQPLQTINFTADEAEQLVSDSVKVYQRITSNVDEILKYCGVSEGAEYIKPYYQALQYNHNLANDEYVRAKMQNDIKCMKNELLSGKQRVHGHYEVFCPDIYGLVEYAFGLEVKGLLPKWNIYSRYWSEHDVSEVDVIRNPHIAMEHRVCHVSCNDEMKKWYRYQESTIVSSMYDTLALALSGADYDGDTVCTTDCPQIISAVKREMDCGNGRLIIKDGETGKELKSIMASDVPGLMEVNARGYKNNIGSVIDKVTNLWSLSQLYPECRDSIKIGTIVGAETIDFAKTGENAAFPDEVIQFLKDKKKGYWMKYLKKNLDAAQNETLSMKRAAAFDVDVEKYKKFVDYDCNMNRLCHLAETKIAEIDRMMVIKSGEEFDYTTLLTGNPHVNRDLYRKVQVLQEEYKKLTDGVRGSYKKYDTNEQSNISLRYRMFYEKCRAELLYIIPDLDKLVDMLILMYYAKKDFKGKSKDLLWNAFSEEMIARAKGENISKQVDFKRVAAKHKKNNEIESKRSRTKKIKIASIDKSDCSDVEVTFYNADRKEIRKLIMESGITNRSDSHIKYERIFSILLYLNRKKAMIDDKHTLLIRNNCPGELSYQTIATLAGVNNDFVEAALMNLKKCGAIDVQIVHGGDLKVDVLWFGKPFGAIWFSTSDYNQAGVRIRDYFRFDKAA